MTVTHNNLPIFDGHNDTLLNLHFAERGGDNFDFFAQNAQGHLDLPRARQGGFVGGFFAIFTPAASSPPLHMQDRLIITSDGYEVLPFPAIDPVYAQQFTIAVAAQLFRLEAASNGQFKVVRTADELAYCLDNSIMAAIFHIEGAEAIDADLDALEVFYQAGLRSLGIVWSRPNAFGHGVPFKFPASPDTGSGLTPAGEDLVRACNRLGILLDLSHLNEQGFWDVARLSTAPLVATHTGVYALCASTRNLTDRQLDAIKDSQGMVGVIFEVANLRADASTDTNTSIEIIVRHIDYLVARLGIDCVGFGSDFDGGITVPQELGDAAGLPNLLTALRTHGYDEAALRKITHENWLRVLRLTW